MQSFLLEDWVTVGTAGTPAATSVVQNASKWIDVGFASEILFHLELARWTSAITPHLIYETAPVRDGASFRTLKNIALPAASDVPIVTRVSLYDDPAQPVSSWVRWRATQDLSGPWDVTFRITVMAHAR